MLVRCTLVALALTLSLQSAPARASEQTCSVSVTGPFQASYRCKVAFIARGGGVRVLISAEKLPRNVKATIPAEFEVPGPVQAQVYPLDRLEFAKSMLTGPRHATYSAVKGKHEQRRGDVTVTITRVENAGGGHEGPKPSLSGKVEARLVPSSKTAQGEARVTIAF